MREALRVIKVHGAWVKVDVSTPIIKPHIKKSHGVWHCFSRIGLLSAAGLGYTIEHAYDEWLVMIREDGLYRKFFEPTLH